MTLWSVLSFSRLARYRTPSFRVDVRHAVGLAPDLPDELKQKIIYNSKIHRYGFVQLKKMENREAKKAKRALFQRKVTPLALRYLSEENSEDEPIQETEVKEKQVSVQLPYRLHVTRPQIVQCPDDHSDSNVTEETEHSSVDLDQLICDRKMGSGRKWMNDYEKYTEEGPIGDEDWQCDYGREEPNLPVSNVPCGGCGALLHSQKSSIPGYLPYEIFGKCSEADLRGLTCQRCHFLQNYNTALSVSVDREYYPNLLKKIKSEEALVILMVDLTDFPCSIWPGILDVLGDRRPVIVVGNKVDLVLGAVGTGSSLIGAESLLRAAFPPSANILHTAIISAKTTFGVERLINKLHNIWQYRGDVYLVGCTNVGKSTLFNALLQSDYCQVKAVDLLQRATTAPWPSTTLSLLKFPILRPEGWRLHLRTRRLQAEKEVQNADAALRKLQRKAQPLPSPTLIGKIGRTFVKGAKEGAEESFSVADRREVKGAGKKGLDPSDRDYAHTKWFYDTPGVVHHDQMLELLTTEEIMLTLPREALVPRCFLLKEGWALLIGGIARLDYVHGDSSIRVAVLSSKSLPVTICTLSNVTEVYSQLVGTGYLGVPCRASLDDWPQLSPGLPVSVLGQGLNTCSADIVLSSAGWVGVGAEKESLVKLEGWTLEGRGVHVRCPSLLPQALAPPTRGPRIPHTPAYSVKRATPNRQISFA